MLRENMSSIFATMLVPKQPAHLQRLARFFLEFFVPSLAMMFYREQITKWLIRLH